MSESRTCKTKNVVSFTAESARSNICGRHTYLDPLHICHNGHRNDVLHRWMEKPVAAHFNSMGHSLDDLNISGAKMNDDCLMKCWESYWIRQLQ